MELELQGWKVKLALGALVLVVVAAPLIRAVYSNRGRADDWHRRAVVAEESVTGLRVVIVERSRALNQRTVQANRLATQLDSTRTALQRSKVSVGSLTRRQRRARERERPHREGTQQAPGATGDARDDRFEAQCLYEGPRGGPGQASEHDLRERSIEPRELQAGGRDSRRVSGAAPLIIGPGWAFLGLLAVGLVAFSLIPGCGLVVVDKPPSGQVRLDAPPLVEVDPGVEARATAVGDPVTRPRETSGAARRAADPQHRVRRDPDRVGLRARLEDPDRAARCPSGRRRAQGRSSERSSEGARGGAGLPPRRVRHRPGRAPTPADAAARAERRSRGVGRRGRVSAVSPSPGWSRESSWTASRERRSASTDA